MQPRDEQTDQDRPHHALPEGTIVAGYRIGAVLGRPGGFGITYFATNELRATERYAIKEFFPRSLAVRRAGETAVHPTRPGDAAAFQHALDRFKDEAMALAKFRHPNIVEVRNFFAANGTAYLLMTYEDGLTLADLLEQNGPLPPGFLVALIPGLFGAIRAVHAGDYIHRDLKPSNIYIRSADHSPVLLDFGAAREALGEEGVTSLTEIRTPGYAPHEQYFRKGAQGEWTDIYALGATLYCCVTGRPPPEAPERKERDTIVPAVRAAKGDYPHGLLSVIDAMLAVDRNERPQTIDSVVPLILPRNSGDTPTRDPNLERPAANADERWVSDLRSRLAPLLSSSPDADKAADDFFVSARKKKWRGTPQFRRGRLPLLVSTLALAVTSGALAYCAADPISLPVILWGSEPLTLATLAAGLAVLAGIPLALIGYFRLARGVNPEIPSIWLAAGATLLAGTLLLYPDFAIDRMLKGSFFRYGDYVPPPGLLLFAVAAGLLWRNRIEILLQRRRWKLARRWRLAYAPSFAILLAFCVAVGGAIGSSQLPQLSTTLPDPVLELLRKAERLAAEDRNRDKDALAAIEEARRINRNDPRIGTTRVTIARSILAEFDPVPLSPSAPFDRVRGAQLRLIIDRAKTFEPDWPGIAQAETMLEALRAGKWGGYPDCAGCPELVIIPAGNLLLGSPPDEKGRDASEGPQYRVTIEQPFLIGRYEVTRGEYARYVAEAAARSETGGCSVWKLWDRVYVEEKERSWRDPGFAQADDHPAVCVSWLDAAGYVEWLSKKTGKRYRLPSEAEWEYAVRANTLTPYSTPGGVRFAPVAGNGPYRPSPPRMGQYINRPDPDLANYWSPGTVPAKSWFPENAFRLKNMHGNAAEWALDCWIADYRRAATDGGPRTVGSFCAERVIRGGGWAGTEADARSAARRFAPIATRRTDLGFRVVRELE